MTVIRIPTAYYDDHVFNRELPAPPILKRTARNYWIDTAHPDMAELISGAEFYVHRYGPEEGWWKAGARALLKTLDLIGEDA